MLDTERLTLRSWRIAGKAHGCDIPEEVARALIGLNSEDTQARMLALLPAIAPVYDAIVQDRREYNHRWVREHGAPVKPGLYALLDAAHARGLKLGVGTSSRWASARLNLQAAGVLDCFDAVVAGDMVPRGKPFPDIYLEAARRLGVQPGDCLVLEDSANGIRAAHAAGTLPVLVPDSWEGEALVPFPEEFKGLLYAVCDSLLEVIPLLPPPQQNPAATRL